MKSSPKISVDVINTIKSIKSIIEIFLEDFEKKKSFDELYPKNNISDLHVLKSQRNFYLNLFDNSEEYYKDLISYFNYYLNHFYEFKNMNLLNKFKSSFTINNFSILTDLLLEILNEKEDAYLDASIKYIKIYLIINSKFFF